MLVLSADHAIAPNTDALGMLLPYTPLHHLLLNQTDPVLMKEPVPSVLVMTSGNLSEEPLVHTNIDARRKLAGLADAFLLHDRDIQVPCDDSVVRPVDAMAVVPLRRARGLVPAPIYLPLLSEPILGVGAEQKNTFCVAAHDVALLRVDAEDLAFLPLRDDAPAGSPVRCYSHPANSFGFISEGIIARYFRMNEPERNGSVFMQITADWARGSSGGPVMDAFGNAVGMVASTSPVFTSPTLTHTASKDSKPTTPSQQMVRHNCATAKAILGLTRAQ